MSSCSVCKTWWFLLRIKKSQNFELRRISENVAEKMTFLGSPLNKLKSIVLPVIYKIELFMQLFFRRQDLILTVKGKENIFIFNFTILLAKLTPIQQERFEGLVYFFCFAIWGWNHRLLTLYSSQLTTALFHVRQLTTALSFR